MVAKQKVIKALTEVMDPELMIDVMTLELIYDVKVNDGKVEILMTYTTPLCPYGQQLQEDVKSRVLDVKGVEKVNIEITFTPKWEPSDDLRAILGV